MNVCFIPRKDNGRRKNVKSNSSEHCKSFPVKIVMTIIKKERKKENKVMSLFSSEQADRYKLQLTTTATVRNHSHNHCHNHCDNDGDKHCHKILTITVTMNVTIAVLLQTTDKRQPR